MLLRQKTKEEEEERKSRSLSPPARGDKKENERIKQESGRDSDTKVRREDFLPGTLEAFLRGFGRRKKR